MVGTNRDLAAMKQMLQCEIDQLQYLAVGTRDTVRIERKLSLLYRQRLAVCAALVNRRIEAANKIVSLSRWASGNGALDLALMLPRGDARAEAGGRQQRP